MCTYGSGGTYGICITHTIRSNHGRASWLRTRKFKITGTTKISWPKNDGQSYNKKTILDREILQDHSELHTVIQKHLPDISLNVYRVYFNAYGNGIV